MGEVHGFAILARPHHLDVECVLGCLQDVAHLVDFLSMDVEIDVRSLADVPAQHGSDEPRLERRQQFHDDEGLLAHAGQPSQVLISVHLARDEQELLMDLPVAGQVDRALAPRGFALGVEVLLDFPVVEHAGRFDRHAVTHACPVLGLPVASLAPSHGALEEKRLPPERFFMVFVRFVSLRPKARHQSAPMIPRLSHVGNPHVPCRTCIPAGGTRHPQDHHPLTHHARRRARSPRSR